MRRDLLVGRGLADRGLTVGAGLSFIALVGALLLFVAGINHARGLRAFAGVIAAHRLTPLRWAVGLAYVTAAGEIAVGLAVVVAMLAWPQFAMVPLGVQAFALAALAGYQAVLRAPRLGVPCGCFGTTEANWWAAGLNGGLAVAAGLAAADVAADVAGWPLEWRGLALAGAGVVLLGGWTYRLVVSGLRA